MILLTTIGIIIVLAIWVSVIVFLMDTMVHRKNQFVYIIFSAAMLLTGMVCHYMNVSSWWLLLSIIPIVIPFIASDRKPNDAWFWIEKTYPSPSDRVVEYRITGAEGFQNSGFDDDLMKLVNKHLKKNNKK